MKNCIRTGAEAFNKVKLTMPKTFTLTELRKALAKGKFPYSAMFRMTSFVDNGVLIKNGNSYSFASNEPVHYSKIVDEMEKWSTYMSNSHLQKREGNKDPKTVSNNVISIETNSVEKIIANAIKILKDNGYKILKPTFTEI